MSLPTSTKHTLSRSPSGESESHMTMYTYMTQCSGSRGLLFRVHMLTPPCRQKSPKSAPFTMLKTTRQQLHTHIHCKGEHAAPEIRCLTCCSNRSTIHSRHAVLRGMMTLTWPKKPGRNHHEWGDEAGAGLQSRATKPKKRVALTRSSPVHHWDHSCHVQLS